jgi:hypothetical protein
MTSDSALFSSSFRDSHLPLYEGKLFHLYDHRYSTHLPHGELREVSLDEKMNPEFECTPRYWVSRHEVCARLSEQGWSRKWLLSWRNIARLGDERTFICCVSPILGYSNSASLVFPDHDPIDCAFLLGNLSSLVFDYIARQKVGGTNMTQNYVKQLAAPRPDSITANDGAFLCERILELTYTTNSLQEWAHDLGYDGPPFRFDPERRSLLRAELDAYYAHL